MKKDNRVLNKLKINKLKTKKERSMIKFFESDFRIIFDFKKLISKIMIHLPIFHILSLLVRIV